LTVELCARSVALVGRVFSTPRRRSKAAAILIVATMALGEPRGALAQPVTYTYIGGAPLAPYEHNEAGCPALTCTVNGTVSFDPSNGVGSGVLNCGGISETLPAIDLANFSLNGSGQVVKAHLGSAVDYPSPFGAECAKAGGSITTSIASIVTDYHDSGSTVTGSDGIGLTSLCRQFPAGEIEYSCSYFALAPGTWSGGGDCLTNVTPLSQGDSRWATDTYDNYDPDGPKCVRGDASTNCSIRKLGCALTTLSMAMTSAGANVLPGGTPLDPGSLNEFMDLPHTFFTEDHDVDWDPTVAAVNQNLKVRRELLGKTSTDALDKALCGTLYGKNLPVIAGVDLDVDGNPTHFVLVTGRTNGQYQIADPGDWTNTMLDTSDFVVRGVITDPIDNSALDLAIGSHAEIMVTDPSAKQTGYQLSTGTILQDIPHSSHFIDSLRDDETGEPPVGKSQFVDIAQPAQGIYSINLVGLQLGSFMFSVHTRTTDGASQVDAQIPGIAGPGSNTGFTLQYSSNPGASSSLVRVATFQSALGDIANALQLGLIDNAGIANALLSKIQAASDAASRGEKGTAANDLNAFENLVSAQTSKHVTGVAPQILTEDGNSLLTQLQ
jgi:hypothetical protein